MERAERNTEPQTPISACSRPQSCSRNEVRGRTRNSNRLCGRTRRSTRALRESEAKFRGIVSQSLVGIVTIENGKLHLFERAVRRHLRLHARGGSRLGPLDFAVEATVPCRGTTSNPRLSGEVDRRGIHVPRPSQGRDVRDIECHGSAMDTAADGAHVSISWTSPSAPCRARGAASCRRSCVSNPRTTLTGLYNRRYPRRGDLEQSWRWPTRPGRR